jgi:hypothetical protein
MDYHFILGVAAVAIGIIGHAPYLYNTVIGKTKPHSFSWLIWGLLAGITFFVQIIKGGGAGAWIQAVIFVLAISIALIGFFKNQIAYVKNIDWFCLMLTLLGIPLWIITNSPLAAIITVSVVTLISIFPTLRKAYYKPHEETATTYITSTFQQTLSILALQIFSLTTSLYSFVWIFSNLTIVSLIFIRRNVMKN